MREISLTQGKVALVDDEDYEFLNQWKWRHDGNGNRKTGYAMRSLPRTLGKQTNISMHRFLLKASTGYEVDHANHEGLDNRRINLRLCLRQENACNRSGQKNNVSGFKGVSFHRGTGKWRAVIHHKGKQYNLGHYTTKEDAAKAYNEGAKKYHKEFASV